MFKYLWLIIFVVLWLLWGYYTAKDCIKVFKEHNFNDVYSFVANLKTESFAFIAMTLLVIIGFSFGEWVLSLAEAE